MNAQAQAKEWQGREAYDSDPREKARALIITEIENLVTAAHDNAAPDDEGHTSQAIKNLYDYLYLRGFTTFAGNEYEIPPRELTFKLESFDIYTGKEKTPRNLIDILNEHLQSQIHSGLFKPQQDWADVLVFAAGINRLANLQEDEALTLRANQIQKPRVVINTPPVENEEAQRSISRGLEADIASYLDQTKGGNTLVNPYGQYFTAQTAALEATPSSPDMMEAERSFSLPETVETNLVAEIAAALRGDSKVDDAFIAAVAEAVEPPVKPALSGAFDEAIERSLGIVDKATLVLQEEADAEKRRAAIRDSFIIPAAPDNRPLDQAVVDALAAALGPAAPADKSEPEDDVHTPVDTAFEAWMSDPVRPSVRPPVNPSDPLGSLDIKERPVDLDAYRGPGSVAVHPFKRPPRAIMRGEEAVTEADEPTPRDMAQRFGPQKKPTPKSTKVDWTGTPDLSIIKPKKSISAAVLSFTTTALLTGVSRYALVAGATTLGAGAIPAAIAAGIVVGAARSYYTNRVEIAREVRKGATAWERTKLRARAFARVGLTGKQLAINTGAALGGATVGYLATEHGSAILAFVKEKIPVVAQAYLSVANTIAGYLPANSPDGRVVDPGAPPRTATVIDTNKPKMVTTERIFAEPRIDTAPSRAPLLPPVGQLPGTVIVETNPDLTAALKQRFADVQGRPSGGGMDVAPPVVIQEPAAVVPPPQPRVHTVVKGQNTLWSIAEKYYGTRGSDTARAVEKLIAANPELVRNPGRLSLGQEIKLPAALEGAKAASCNWNIRPGRRLRCALD